MKAYVKNQVRLTNTHICRCPTRYGPYDGVRRRLIKEFVYRRLSSGRDMYHVYHRLQRNYQR